MGIKSEDSFDHILQAQDNTYPDMLMSIDQLSDIGPINHDDPPVLAPKRWRNDALGLIHKISSEVNDSSLVSPILHEIATVITSSFPITFSAIELYDENQYVSFSAISSSNKTEQIHSLNIVSLNNTLAGEVFRRESTLLLTDTQKNNYVMCPSYSQIFPIYHYIGVPIYIEGHIKGVLSIATSHHIIVDKETVTWAETIAHHISALLTREAIYSQLKQQEHIATDMLNALASPTMMCKADGKIIHVNDAFRSIVEVFHARGINESSTNIFDLFNNTNQNNSYVHEFHRNLNDLFSMKTQLHRLDILLTQSGFYRWYLVTMSYVTDLSSAIVMFVDITDRKRAEEQLAHEMLHDQGTGLANRLLFHDHVDLALSSNMIEEQPICIFALEVGRYAFIIESLGYEAADRIIMRVAKRLESITQTRDLIARVNSSEFAIYIEHIHDDESARDFALSIIDLFRTPFEIDGQEVILTPSVGIAINNIKLMCNADMILHDAHSAMTQSRESNTIKYSFASVSRSSQAYKKLQKEKELHNAITNEELSVFYQPEIDVMSGRIMGAEALVRWVHPKLGILTPDHFIDLAQESNLIDKLFEYVLATVVKDAQKLFSSGFDFTLWMNLSPSQFSNDQINKKLADYICASEVPAYMFGIEITENAVMENSHKAIETLEQLKSIGISLALDDFGTGYSSLAYLQKFPVDVVKIDRAFIKELGKTKSATEIVSAVIGLAHGLHLHVLAEGVETQQNVSLLRELGCDLAQGFHFSRPLTFSKLYEFLSPNK